jgi:hypothetical protein
MAIFLIERFVAHREEQDELNKSNDGWNEGPTKKQIKDAQTNLTEIELVAAEAAQKKREECCGNPAFAVCCHWPEVDGYRLAKLANAAFRAYFRFCFYDSTTLTAKFFINGFSYGLAHDFPLRLMLLEKLTVNQIQLPVTFFDAAVNDGAAPRLTMPFRI